MAHEGDRHDPADPVAATIKASPGDDSTKRRTDWRTMLGTVGRRRHGQQSEQASLSDGNASHQKRPDKWSMGILNDQETEEVPGSILLLSEVSEYNEPLGLRNAPARTSSSSLPSPYPPSRSGSRQSRRPFVPEKKRTPDGNIVLEPQPDDSMNDPLNWKQWRRDLALLSLGFYCMVGGGMTPVLAAGFSEVSKDFDIPSTRVALTTGLYMMGLGIGSVILSPTAILFGKRPVYLVSAICFILAAVWCALSPNFASLIVARIFMGLSVSSVECLPSATVAEIFFLHEKAYRLGIYTLLLLGGKNIIPLVSAAIIQSLHWRWVFWIVAMVVGFGFCLLFLFVPETFWDRTPRPHRHAKLARRFSVNLLRSPTMQQKTAPADFDHATRASSLRGPAEAESASQDLMNEKPSDTGIELQPAPRETDWRHGASTQPAEAGAAAQQSDADYFTTTNDTALEAQVSPEIIQSPAEPRNPYTKHYLASPPKSALHTLKPWSGRLSHDRWLRVAFRPFVLFAYPSILWSTLVYSLSIGWLIVLSESVTTIYESSDTYSFTPLQAGLVYISPFVGGILGTAVAGKVSDIMVRALARRNGGLYEPEFRLLMGLPIAVFTTIGLMGYGWAAQERDRWIVPTIFFGFISFGCSLGSTTSITFAVDSYRQYAGEALVTLNFSKNIFHGLVFSLFFNKWLDAEGSKDVFIAIGGIQLACLLTTIPMYIYGKRARMWTVRKNFMEKF